MTTQIDKGSEKQVKFRYDGANRRVYKRYKQWIRDLPPIDQRSANTGELQKYQKGVSYEQQILDAYAGYSAGQTSLKMIPGGHWEYTTNLYLHGGGDQVLVEYTKGLGLTFKEQ